MIKEPVRAAYVMSGQSTPQGSELAPLIMASEPNTPGHVG